MDDIPAKLPEVAGSIFEDVLPQLHPEGRLQVTEFGVLVPFLRRPEESEDVPAIFRRTADSLQDLLMRCRGLARSLPPIHVVHNWYEEFRDLPRRP